MATSQAEGFSTAMHRLELICCWRGQFYEQHGQYAYHGGEAQLCTFAPFLTFPQLRMSLAELSHG